MSTIDTVNVRSHEPGVPEEKEQNLELDLSGGPFAPGLTTEPTGLSEIEFTVDLGGDECGAGTCFEDTLIVIGSAGSDRIYVGRDGINLNADDDADVSVVRPFPLPVSVRAGAGDDFITGMGGAGTGAVFPQGLGVHGELGNDRMVGGVSGDFLSGGPGDDRCYGGPHDAKFGEDQIRGEDGNDILSGQGANDTISGGEGNDVIYGGPGKDIIYGVGGADVIYGNEGDDRINGYDGPDVIVGGGGEDALRGGYGTDTFYARDGVTDKIWGQPDFDRARIDPGIDRVSGIERFF